MPAVGLPDRGHDGSWLARLDDGHDLIGLGTSEVASHEVIASAWGIFLNGYTPFLGAVLNPVVVLRSDVTPHLSTDGINLVRGPEQAYRPLFLLKGLDRRVEQDTIEATIHKTDVILMVFVEGVHGILQRGQIPGAYSTERLSVLRGPEFRLPYPSGISRAKPLPSWFIALGPFLLLAARKPSLHRSLITFAACQSLAHASVMTIQTVEAWKHGVHRDFTDVVLFGVIGGILLALTLEKRKQS